MAKVREKKRYGHRLLNLLVVTQQPQAIQSLVENFNLASSQHCLFIVQLSELKDAKN
jgi:hypothetical protein